MDVGDIDADGIVLLGFQTFGESHRLGLHAAVGTEGIDGFHALVGRHDGGEAAVGVVLEFLYGHASAEASAIGQLARVVEEIGVSFVVGNATVVGERVGLAERHDLASILPRACRRRRRAVADVLRHSAGSIEQLVGAVALRQPRAFHVAVLVFLALLALAHHRASEGLLGHVQLSQLAAVGNHVAVELQVVTLRIAPHQPGLAVVVDEDCWVDVVPRAVLKQRLSDGILERPRRRVAHSHTDGHAAGEL